MTPAQKAASQRKGGVVSPADTQGPEAAPTFRAPGESAAWLVVAARFYPATDPDTQRPPPSGDDCDGTEDR